MPKVEKFSAFHTLALVVRFLPDSESERNVSGTRVRKQRWATSCNIMLMDKNNKILKQRIANGLEEIPVAIKKLVQSAGLTIDAGMIRPKKKPGPKR